MFNRLSSHHPPKKLRGRVLRVLVAFSGKDIQQTRNLFKVIKMRIAAIVDTLECVLRKQTQLSDCKDDAAAETLRATIAELTAVLPPPESIPMIGSIRVLAELNAEMTTLAEQLTANEKEMERLKKEASKDAWKWSARKEGPKESAAVVALRETNTTLNTKLEELERKAEPFRKLLAMEQRAQDEEAQLRAWAASGYADPRPAPIVAMLDAYRRELEEGCERLRLPRKRSCIVAV